MNNLKSFIIKRQKVLAYTLITVMFIILIYEIILVTNTPVLDGLPGGRTMIIQSLNQNVSQRISIYPNGETYRNEEKGQMSFEQWSTVIAKRNDWCSRSTQTETQSISENSYRVDISCGLFQIKTVFVPHNEVSDLFSQ